MGLKSGGLDHLESSNRSYVKDLCGHGVGLMRFSCHGLKMQSLGNLGK